MYYNICSILISSKMKAFSFIITLLFSFGVYKSDAQILQVKEGRSALVKKQPTGNGEQIVRLAEGTRVSKLGEVPRYYSIQLQDGRTGYSYKGNFVEISGVIPTSINKESLWARSDVLKIIVLDVEVGDATLVICPLENGEQDIILIDTGERHDADRIKEELINNGFSLSGKPIFRFYNSHYDSDHMGDIQNIAHLVEVAYDVGDNDMPKKYRIAMEEVDRRLITLDYQETFSGGVTIECVAVNQSTDFDPNLQPNKDKNTNSIALIVSYNDFDYFTAGDLTFKPEKSLAKGIRNCDAYHVNHHGSKATSSHIDFIKKLDPEIAVASNGHRFGHPTHEVAQRLINNESRFYQTNKNSNDKAHHPPDKFLGDNTFYSNKRDEDAEGATGSIRIIVDSTKYYVIMPRLPLNEGTFNIEK